MIPHVKIKLLTAALLLVALSTTLHRPQAEADRQLAEDLLKSADIQQVRLSDDSDPPAFQYGTGAVLFFEGEGMQGLIRGVIVIDEDRVVDLRILRSDEGIEHNALDSPDFLKSYRTRPAKPPIVVDGVSGATISSQAVTDAINLRLKQWTTYSKSTDKDSGVSMIKPCRSLNDEWPRNASQECAVRSKIKRKSLAVSVHRCDGRGLRWFAM